jgi:uncharacterized cofD-like protein
MEQIHSGPDIYNNDHLEAARAAGPEIVAIGGGSGLSTLLKGLKLCTENITAVVTVADDGGGSGTLRQEMGILPPGDVRNCLLALANTEPVLEQLLSYRFTEGCLEGQNFGNLFLAALTRIYGSFVEAVRRMSDVLAITGRVLPVTTADVNLEAEFENGTSVVGESNIFSFKKQQKCRIKRIRLLPEQPEPLPETIRAIANADMILLGPGSLYTSIIPNLLVGGVADAIIQANCLKVYVCNVMTQEGETEGYTAFEHVESLFGHAGGKLFGTCLVNSAPFKPELIARYKDESAEPTLIERDRFAEAGISLIERDLLSDRQTQARHDPLKLAAALMEAFVALSPRRGVFGEYDRLTADWLMSRVHC